MRKVNNNKGVFMRNSCLSLLVLVGFALGVEISGNGLVETSNGNNHYYLV